MKSRLNWRSTLFVATFLILIGIWMGCDKKGTVNPTAPVPTQVTLVDTVYLLPTTLIAGGSATAHALIVDLDGDPMVGTNLTFSTTRGSFLPENGKTAQRITDSLGMATATLRTTQADSNETATVKATVGRSADSAFLFISAVADTGSPPPTEGYIQVWAEPESTYADGHSTTLISAEVTDENHIPIPGTQITFSAKLGQITPISKGMTDSAGIASATLKSSVSGVDTVTARCGDLESNTAVKFLAIPGVGSVRLLADSTSLAVGGQSTSRIRAMVADEEGKAIPDGTPVTFSTPLGILSEEGWMPLSISGVRRGKREAKISSLDEMTLTAHTVNGVATVILISESRAGLADLTARAGDAADTLLITFRPGEPANIQVTTASDQLVANGSDTTSVFAQLTDGYGNAVGAGRTVNFTTSLGSITPTVLTNSSGQAVALLTSGLNIGTVQVTANCGELLGLAEVVFTSETAVAMEVSANPTAIPADGISFSTITANVYDAENNPVSDGAVVYFSTTAGMVTASATTLDGVATATLTSGTGVGTAEVRARCGQITGSTHVDFLAGFPSSITFSVNRDTLPADGNHTAYITVTVLDASGNYVTDGTLIRFAAGEPFRDEGCGSPGTLGNGYYDICCTSYEDFIDLNGNHVWDEIGHIQPSQLSANGVATIYYTAGTEAGDVTIKCTAGTPPHHISVDGTIVLWAGDIYSISLQVSRSQIQVRGTGGMETSLITARAYDKNGNPVPDGTEVEFSVVHGPDGGENLNSHGWGPVAVSTVNGRGSVTLNSGLVSGTVEVLVKAGELEEKAPQITIMAGPPASISLSADKPNVAGWELDGVTDTVSAFVHDQYNNWVENGTAVYFTCDEGAITGAAVTQGECYDDLNGNGHWDDSEPFSDLNGNGVYDPLGVARAVWTSCNPRDDGDVVVRAETAGGTVSDQVQFFSSGPPASVEFLYVTPSSIDADGNSTAEARVRVLDVNQNPVVEGTQVTFTATQGDITSPASTFDGWHDSVADAVITSSTLPRDDSPWPMISPDDGIGDNPTIRARSGFASACTTMIFTTAPASAANSNVNAPGNVPIFGSASVTVSIRDLWDNPLGGHMVEVTASEGFINGQFVDTTVTNSYGIGTGLTFTAPLDSSKVSITATDLDPRGGITVTTSVTVP